jgi:hypothetical protein
VLELASTRWLPTTRSESPGGGAPELLEVLLVDVLDEEPLLLEVVEPLVALPEELLLDEDAPPLPEEELLLPEEELLLLELLEVVQRRWQPTLERFCSAEGSPPSSGVAMQALDTRVRHAARTPRGQWGIRMERSLPVLRSRFRRARTWFVWVSRSCGAGHSHRPREP